ncbi:ExbD/TolR family protein [Pseudobacteriovorax antillogorgiicola]|uniref:Biopolymer transport protein ExbD n=1 Tax=Pseudobacteriovorax antillogorgiicola TaxID=1513793 RepID=A0A1Y6CG81_9BACT|nr:biopolymer transporter ExbD [Pseudobacteriovorax antillogorgiicola]TCS48716.1 biopolymer transport protein ExbD [Pseudobacteriovorax antillogorgiicola]SMF54584.1 biopolymer transport protein ExbD [Pseudobacteriovorax antillogorgiicola]
MKLRRKKEQMQGIDISPLIDMVFILLIFFMVSTTFNKDMKLDLNRPGASTATAASTKSVRIYIDANSDIYVDEQLTKPWVLQSKVREILSSNKEKPILVVTDKGVPSEKLIEVVDQCRMGGAKDVGVATEKEAGA